MKKRWLVGVLALSLGLASSVSAALEKVRTVEGITEYKLPNGLRVLLFPDNSKPTVTVNIDYLVGSRFESYGETGMAHLLEHMLFKGTPKHPNVPKALQAHGADFNANTWLDRTTYFETLKASEENLAFALDLEADRMVNSYVRKSDLDSEMTVVRNEFEAGENSPPRILEERMFSTAYLWHGYGRSTIGAKSDIEGVPIPRLQAFYRKYYQPDNAVLMVAGRFDDNKVKALIEKSFGAIPKPSRILEAPYTEEPAQDGERLVTLRRVGDVQVLGAVYHIPQGAHPDSAAIQVLDHILTNSPSGRLYKALVTTQKATSVGGEPYLLHDPGAYVLNIQVPKDKSLDECKTILDQVIQEVIDKGVTEEEMKRAQVAFDKDNTDLFNDSQSLTLQLSEWAAMGDWRLIFVNRERLQKVTAADVQKVAATYLIPLNRTLGRYYPTTTAERVTIPGTVNIAQTANSYVPKAEVSTGEAFELTAANLLKRSERTKINGLTVTLLPKKNRGETVVAQISLSLGTTQSLGDQKLVNSYVTAMLNRGTRTLTRQQLRDKLDSLKAQVSISGSANQTTISIETLRPNLPEVLTLMGQMLKDSAFDEKEFAQIQQQSITSLEAQRTDPQRLAFDAVNLSTYQPNSLFNVGPLDTRIATVKKLNIPQLKEFYKQFYGAGLGTVTVVGDFDPTQVKKSLNEIFNNWTAPQPAQYLVPTQADLAPAPIGSEVIRVKDKENAVFVAAQTIALKEENPQYTALEAGVYIFGGSTLSSRFGDRVRQKEGLSYGAGSFLRSRPKGEFVQLINYAISNPRNSPKVEIGFSEEIKRLVTEGITADELKRTQDALIQEQSVALASDGVLADSSNGLMLRGKTFQELADREARIRALTVAQVNQALKTWIKLDQFQLVKSGDLP